jgi:hypothetical protein
MADLPYTGAAMRAAHFAFRPPVPGINPEHEKPDPEPDPFAPAPEGVQAAAYDVYQPEDVSVHTEMQQRPFDHWAHLQPPVPSSVERETAGIAAAARMVHNHACIDYRPDQYPLYKHADQGRSIEFERGREPWQAGESVSEEMSYLVMGKNAYDQTNQPNEVYGGDSPNVGRYRLGMAVTDFGRYEYWTLQGQDAELRAYTGLEPAFPVEKPRIEDSAPYTPNSSGTARFVTPAFQIPSLFGTPSETALTDFEAAGTTGYWDGGGGFLEEEQY